MNHVVRTAGSASAGTPVLWSILSDDGAASGPVDLDTLRRMAAEGQLTATSRLSTDGEHWIQAAHMPELEMDWLVLVSQEEVLGPFAVAALEVLRAAGHIPPEAQVFRRQSAPMSGSQGLQLVQRALSAETQRREAESDIKRLRADLEAKDLEFEAERQQLAAEVSRLRAEALRRDAEIAALKTEAQQLGASLEDREAIEARLVDGEREHARLTAERDELQHRIDLLRDEHRAAQQAAEEARSTLDAGTTQARQQLEAALALLRERNRRLLDWAREFAALADTPLPAPAEAPSPEPRTPRADSAARESSSPPTPAEAAPPPPDPAGAAEAVSSPRSKRKDESSAGGIRRLAPQPSATTRRIIPDAEVDVLPPEPVDAPERKPFVRSPHPLHPGKLAALEAQAQQELARLKTGRAQPPFWTRRTPTA